MRIVFANEAEIPEHLKKDAVAQGDGSFVYEGDGLIRKNQELLDDNKKLKALADLVKGLDTSKLTPDAIKNALTEHERAGERETEINRRIAEAVQENARKHQQTLDAANAKVAKMQASIEKHLIDSELTRAIASEKGDSKFIAPVLRGRVKVVQNGDDFEVRVLNERGEIDLDQAGQPVSVLGLVQGAKKDAAFASVFQAPASTGSGAPVATGNSGAAQGVPGALAVNAQGRVDIPRNLAKDFSVTRDALKLVNGDYSKLNFVDPPAAQGATV